MPAKPMQRFVEGLFVAATWLSALVTLTVVGVFLAYLLFRGFHTLGTGLFFGNVPIIEAITGRMPVWHGIWPAVAGTFLLVLISAAIAVPLGLASGIYLAEYAHGRWKKPFELRGGFVGRYPVDHHGAVRLCSHPVSQEDDSPHR